MAPSRAETQAATRRAVLDAAYAEFSNRRYADVSMSDIAARAGFTKGAIYSNFESKTDLLFEVLSDRLRTVGDDYIAVTLGAVDADLGSGIGERASKTQSSDLGYFRVLASVWAEAVHDERIGQRLAQTRAEHRGRIADAIAKRADDVGIELPVPAIHLAAGITNMSMATMLETVIDPDVSADEIHQTMIDVILAGVLSLAGPPTP